MTDFMQFESINGGRVLWVAKAISPERVNVLINTAYILFSTSDEERDELDAERLAELTQERMEGLEESEVNLITYRMVRLLIDNLMMEGVIFPDQATAAAGLDWLKDQCASLGILVPTDRHLLASNIVLNYALMDMRDQYGLFLLIVKNAGLDDEMGIADEIASVLQATTLEAVNG